MESFTVEFTVPNGNISAVLPWLSVLDDRLAPEGAELNLVPGREGPFWLHQVLLLTIGLLHVHRAPVFDPIKIIRCKRSSSADQQWEASGRLPDRSLVPAEVFKHLLQLAFKLANWMGKADVHSTADRNLLFAAIEKEVLQAFPRRRTNGYSTFEILRAAHKLGIPFRPLPAGVFQLGWGANARYIERSTTNNDSNIGRQWAGNKLLAAQVLRQTGMPAPAHFIVASLDEAKSAAERLGYPVVVKPVDLERGEGVNVDVDAEDLEAAFTQAFDLSPGKVVIVEQQLAGLCHRILVASGRLVYAAARQPIGVYGDGKSTIRELVAAEYETQQRKPSWSRSKIKPLDDVALAMLARQGLEPDGIPPAEQFVSLRRIETTALGGNPKDVTDVVHPENVRLAVAVAELMGLEVAGVDIMTEDIAQPWYSNGAMINEVNFAPLLGGRVSLPYISEYLSGIVRDQGRIPMFAYEGGTSAQDACRRRWDDLCAEGVAAFLVNDRQALDPKGNVYPIAATSLAARVDALLMRREVAALVIVSPSFDDPKWLEDYGVDFVRLALPHGEVRRTSRSRD